MRRRIFLDKVSRQGHSAWNHMETYRRERHGAVAGPKEAEGGWSIDSDGGQEKLGLGGGRIHLQGPGKAPFNLLDFALRVKGSHGRLQ